MKLNSITLAALLLIAGCSGNQDSGNSGQIEGEGCKTLDITEAMEMEPKSIEDYLESVKVIPLESSTRTALADFADVTVGKRSIFATSRGNAMVFGLDGKAIRILSKGQGPEEYVYAGTIKYLPEEDCFYLWDIFQSKIIKYDGLGQHVTNYYVKRLYARDFFPADRGFLFTQNPEESEDGTNYKVFLTDSIADIRKTWVMGPDVLDAGRSDNFRIVDGEIAFGISVRNIIYTYKDGQISKRYEIKYDGMPEIDCEKLPKWSEVEKEYPDTYFLNGSLETRDYLFLNLKSTDMKIVRVPILYNKKSGKYLKINDGQSSDSFISWMFTRGILGVAGDGESFVGIVEPSRYLEQTNPNMRWDGSNYGNILSDTDIERLKALTDDDNPVVVLIKVKSDI